MDFGCDLNTRMVDGVGVLSFDRVTIREAREFLRVLESLGRYVTRETGLRILLDMSNVEYLSSTALGHLVGILKKSRASQGVFKLCCLEPPIQEIFDVMRFDKMFEVFASVEDAVASFQKGTEGVKEAVQA